VAAGDSPDEARFALHLEHLHPDRTLNRDAITRDALAFVMAIDGHHDARFVLQMAAVPRGSSHADGRLDVHLITTVTGSDGEAPSLDRIAELSDDLLDISSAPPVRWSFSPVADESLLHAALAPVDPQHIAEIARREEPCSPVAWTKGGRVGFGAESTEPSLDRSLWSMWTLGPATHDLRRLATVLLAQEAPICLRIL